MSLRALLNNLLVGIPGGILIIMAAFMFRAVLSLVSSPGRFSLLILLGFCAFVVGLLAGLMRPYHALGTALFAGITAAVILLSTWLGKHNLGDPDLAFGPAGMLAVLAFCLLGAWLLPRLRRRS